jgi:P-type Cu2+ transporter
MSGCFHCGEPIPPGTRLELTINGRRRPVCCPGCLAVAALIEEHGLARFYEFRSAPALRPQPRAAAAARTWAVCDRPEVAGRLTRAVAPGRRELRCRVDGVTCAACVWLLERALRDVAGVGDITVNPVSGETAVEFDPARTQPSALLKAIERFGFAPRPALLDGDGRHVAAQRAELKRLAVAGLGFGQVMMLSMALYLGAFKHMDAAFASFFTLVSMLVATPVVLYSGTPIFRAAWSDLKRGRLGMDVPVGLAIGAALLASLVNALRGSGPVYFDSATMFVFFLTLGRFLESRARRRASGLFDALSDLQPLGATRRRGEALERIGTVELEVGDCVVVEPGEAVPADGELASARGTFDEALLSGESRSRERTRGDSVLGGSLNAGRTPIEVVVTRLGADSYLERVGSLLQRALADRPRFLRLADRWAAGFIAALLVVTVAAAAAWLALAPGRAFEVVLALLVVTCPCALSLAAPTAFAVALGQLARRGLLLRSARVLERLGDVTTWMFDKTGTLTVGPLSVSEVETFGRLAAASCRTIAAALEAGIEHPIARALRGDARVAAADAVDYELGHGVAGSIAGKRYQLGSARYVHTAPPEADERSSIWLADGAGPLARFVLADALRPEAKETLARLAARGHEVMLVSGDAAGPVRRTAETLGLGAWRALQTPSDKLELVRERQRHGGIVAAVGDGVNDAPLLAQADVSVALLAGSQLAQASADVVFTGTDLRALAQLLDWAAATRRVVRQNLIWAVVYNLAAVPLAAAGLLAPWMAAIGMSISSLVVVGNALRLGRRLADTPRAPAPSFVPLREQAAQ